MKERKNPNVGESTTTYIKIIVIFFSKAVTGVHTLTEIFPFFLNFKWERCVWVGVYKLYRDTPKSTYKVSSSRPHKLLTIQMNKKKRRNFSFNGISIFLSVNAIYVTTGKTLVLLSQNRIKLSYTILKRYILTMYKKNDSSKLINIADSSPNDKKLTSFPKDFITPI